MNQTTDKRFEEMNQTSDKRFEAIDKRFEEMLSSTNKRFDKIDNVLKSIQNSLGKPFEQFGRNIVSKILEKEGFNEVKIESKELSDPKRFVSESRSTVEIDGFSMDPPIIVEITSILKEREKVERFLKKKTFVEKEFSKIFRGFFVAASTELTSEEIGELTILLRGENCELINL